MIKILVPLDGSSTAEKAIPHAAAMANTFSSEIELIHVVAAPSSDDAKGADSVDWHLRKRQGQVYLNDTANTLREQSYEVTTTLRDGDPAKEIIQRAIDCEADLLILTRFGMGSAEGFWGGGTAQKVVSASSASILLIDPRVEFQEECGYRHVLVALDGCQRSEWAASFAAMVAQTFDGSIELLKIIERPSVYDLSGVADETQQRIRDHVERAGRSQANFQLNHLTCRLSENLPAKSTIVVSDDVAYSIESAANSTKADLLVMAAQAEYASTAGRYGPICESLLAHMRRPLLVLRSESADLSKSHFQSVFLDESQPGVGKPMVSGTA